MENLTPEQQIQQIDQQYQEQHAAAPETEPGHETMSRVVEGVIQQQDPSFKAPSHDTQAMPESMPTDEQSTVQRLVTESFPPVGKGVWAAIKEARQSDDPAVLDAFHAALSGELYDQLVASKQIKQVA